MEEQEFKDSNVVFCNHPLIQHKISLLRNENTGTNEFRKLVEEIARLEGYEALRDLPLEERRVKTPIAETFTPFIAGKKLCLVPILRAGLGMVEGLLSLVPTAKVGFIGMYRDETTHIPHEYYCKIPSPIEQRTIVVLDPMLATGGSACDAIEASTSSSSASSPRPRACARSPRPTPTSPSTSATSITSSTRRPTSCPA